MPNNVSGEDYDEDITIELAQYTEPALSSALMIRRRLDSTNKKNFNQDSFNKKFPGQRNLDIGCGNCVEKGWIRLDCNERYKPDLLMDAHNILLGNNCIDLARMHYVLGYVIEPSKVLSEVWRILKPNSLLYLVNGAPASDIQLMPGVRHSFPKLFWEDVNKNNPRLYIPEDSKGKWELEDERYDWSQTANKLASKLKLTRELVVTTFRNVVSKQYITLRKISK